MHSSASHHGINYPFPRLGMQSSVLFFFFFLLPHSPGFVQEEGRVMQRPEFFKLWIFFILIF